MKNSKYSFAYPDWIDKNKILDPKRLDILRRTRDKVYSAFPNRVKFFKPVAYLNSDSSSIIQDFKIFGKLSNAYIFRLWFNKDNYVGMLGTYIPNGNLLLPEYATIKCNTVDGLKVIIDNINIKESKEYIFNMAYNDSYIFNRSKIHLAGKINKALIELIADYKEYNRKEFRNTVIGIYKPANDLNDTTIDVCLYDCEGIQNKRKDKEMEIDQWNKNILTILNHVKNYNNRFYPKNCNFNIVFEYMHTSKFIYDLINKKFIYVINSDYYKGEKHPYSINLG